MLLLSCGFFFLFLAVFSFVVYPFTLRFFKHVPLAMPDGKVRSVTLLFCCHNEAKTIGSKLDNIRALKDAFPQLEGEDLSGCLHRWNRGYHTCQQA